MMIPTTRNGGQTIEMMDESLLEKREGVVDNANEYSTWVEYWLDGQLVHRSASVALRNMPT